MTALPDVCAYRQTRPWWRDAVVYQVYPRSFADLDGDGIGDLPGLIDRLDYLVDLGVDAVWISPFYVSPLNDGGYDVTDYRAVDPRLGTLEDVDTLITRAHERGLRVVMDIVPNHTSSEHPWFREVLDSGPGSPAWSRYLIREGKGAHHDQPPNNWRSVFHGRGWSRLVLADGTESDYWYLHLFDDTQPDLDWTNADVREEFASILRFWFDRGVDGFRIDVAHGLVKDILGVASAAPYWDQDGVHEIYREWRAIADSYDPPRILCGETWAPSAERLALYQRPDELHTSFNFGYLAAGWDAESMRRSIDETVASHARVGAPATWVLSNHDVIRHATRFAPSADGRPVTGPTEVDAKEGLKRAQAASVFMLGLPGSAYLYQGEELGLPEVFDLPDEARQDPVWHRSNGQDTGRDGCRVPLPWNESGPTHGFGPGDAAWLPQPDAWADYSVARQDGDQASTLTLYRSTLARRRCEPALGDGPMRWLEEVSAQVLALERRTDDNDPSVLVIINTGESVATLPAAWGTEVLVASGPEVAVLAEDDQCWIALGPATAVWLRGPATDRSQAS
jgi:alpha-glucosidase